MKISLDNIEIGMYVGQDLYNESGQLITPSDTVVTPLVLSRLKKFNIQSVEIVDPNSSDFLFDVTHTKGFKSFKADCEKAQKALTSSFDGLLKKDADGANIEILTNLSTLLYENNKSNLALIDMIYGLHAHSDVLYSHSINVGIIAGHLGRWLRFPEDEVKLLVSCGLFHDIGKLLVPKEVLDKPEQLTPSEYKIAQLHAQEGFDLLNKFDDVDPRIKNVVLLHHERCDGSGYPKGLKGDKIDKFSKIVAIADIYEAMTSQRCYREPVCPFTVAAYLEKEGLHKFETKYVLRFLNKILVSYLYTKVLLSTGEEATIILINRNIKSRPLVMLENGRFIDLAKHLDIEIVKMLT